MLLNTENNLSKFEKMKHEIVRVQLSSYQTKLPRSFSWFFV